MGASCGKKKTPNLQKTKPELANEHKTCNLAGSVGNKNHFYDMVGDNRLIEEIIETIKNSKYNPQEFWFVCKLYVHRGQGGEGSEAEDTILLSTTNQKYHIEALDESTTNTIVEKFNIKFERNSNDGQNLNENTAAFIPLFCLANNRLEFRLGCS